MVDRKVVPLRPHVDEPPKPDAKQQLGHRTAAFCRFVIREERRAGGRPVLELLAERGPLPPAA